MSDTTADPITLEAFNPADLLMDANMRTGAEGTVTKADVALCKTIAAGRADGCGNNVPVIIVRRPGGQLRVRTGHRRTIGCQRAGVPVLGFIAGDEGDERADRRARLIEQWNENHHRTPTTLADDAVTVLALFDEGAMTEAGIAKAIGLPGQRSPHPSPWPGPSSPSRPLRGGSSWTCSRPRPWPSSTATSRR
jgi:hypothetical protein